MFNCPLFFNRKTEERYRTLLPRKRQTAWFLLLGILAAFFFSSCISRYHKLPEYQESIVFPPPPDTARIQFLTKISNSIDIVGQRKGIIKYILGEDPGLPIIKPYGIAIRDGVIYICDTMLRGLEIIDLKKATFRYFKPHGRGQLRKPINCTLDEDGYLYVADSERRQVVIYDPNLKYAGAIGGERNSKPSDVKIFNDRIWVVDIKQHKVKVYSKKTRKLIFSFPDAKPGTKQFLFSPTNLDIQDGRVYVSDFGDFKVKIYTLEGEYIGSVGSYGKALGQFVRPKGVAVDRDLNLYVVDAGFETIQIFNKDGKLLMFFGGPYKGPGFMWLPAKVVIDYDNLEYFQKYVDPDFNLKYLVLVTNQYGPDKINIYGFVEPKNE